MSKNSKRTCCVYGCLQTKRENPDWPFFSLPTDRHRCKQWLKIIGRSDLMERADLKPRSYSVCSVHFEEHMLKSVKYLLPDAVPCKHLPDSNNTNQAQLLTIASSSIDWDDIILNPDATTTEFPITEAKPKIHETVNTVPAPTTLTIPGLQDDFSRSFCKFIEEQVKIQKNIDKDSKDFLFYALNMYLLNPQAYCFVRDALNLPDERVVRNIKLKLSPKMDNRVLDCLASKLKSFPEKAKYCAVSVNTVLLKHNLYYDILNDDIVGLQNVNGNQIQEGAGLAYVMMLRGILVKWEQPVAYCFLSAIKNIYQLERWIDEAIAHLFEIGFHVMALVTNQGSNLKKYAQDIKGISPKKTYFEVNGKKINYIFEASQLLICFRNNLMNKDIYINDNKASWEYIKTLYTLESKKKHSLIPKINVGHIKPNNSQKMYVKYAAEIFSKTVSAAILTYVDMELLPEEARHTADFCLFLNNLYDVLNSSTYENDNIYKRAFGSHESQKQVIIDALRVFETLVCKKSTVKRAHIHMGTVTNMQVTLLSILALTKDLNDLGYKYILMERLNQDPLENFLDLSRRMVSKYNRSFRPTPVQFCRNFSKLFIKYSLVKSSLSNRPKAFEKFFEDASQLGIRRLDPIPSERSQVSLSGDTEYRITLPDDFPTVYVASYLFYKCERAHNCAKFKNYANTLPDLAKTHANNTLNQKAKFHGKLKLLHLPFIKYIEKLEIILFQNFYSALCLKLGAELFRVMKGVSFNPPCRCFPTSYLITVLIRLRIYSTIKKYNKTSNISISDFLTELCEKDSNKD